MNAQTFVAASWTTVDRSDGEPPIDPGRVRIPHRLLKLDDDAAILGFARLLCDSSAHQSDGVVTARDLRVAKVAIRTVAKLASAGYLAKTDIGWQIVHPERYMRVTAGWKP